MTLNSFFLQGSPNEQFLIQDLINEQLKIYGIEVYYLPRKIFKTDNIIREVQSSKFEDSFLIEVYLDNYEGYSPGSDIMSKFGLTLKNEINLIMSKERYEEFIAPFLEGISTGILDLDGINPETFSLLTRPKEGDLIYFPLGERLFEIKRVESEKPFYQLGRNYVYELSCELYEFENELIDTSIEEVDGTVDAEGYITTLDLVGVARTASATAVINSGYIKQIFLNNDGYKYRETPIVNISPPPEGGINATAVAITSTRNGIRSIGRILLTNAGSGYIIPPKITILGGGGSGAAATCSIASTGEYGVSLISITDGGRGYVLPPTITISEPTGIGNTSLVESFVNPNKPPFNTSPYTANYNDGYEVSSIGIINAGSGYTYNPSVTFVSLPSVGIGTFIYNETVIGTISNTKAVVRNFKKFTNINTIDPPVQIQVSINTGKFYPGEIIVGSISSARYMVKSYDTYSYDTSYEQNKEFELEGKSIIDFSENNPFGDY